MTEIVRATYTPFFNGLISDVVSIPIGEGRRLLFLSGVADQDPNGKPFASNILHTDIEGQVRGVWKRIGEILAHHNASYASIVKTTTYVTDARFLPQPVAGVLKETFQGGPAPLSTALVVSGLAYPAMLVEVDVIAVAEEAK